MNSKQRDIYNDVIASLDIDKVKASITQDAPMFFDRDDIALVVDMVFAGTEKWLVHDIENYTLKKVEDKREVIICDADPTHFVCDLEFTDNDEKDIIVDWKTSHRDLDLRWENRYKDSWQWKTFLRVTNADTFIYRGINTQLKTRTVVLNRYPSMNDAVDLYYKLTSKARSQLVDFVPWPRNMPGACFAFGRDCPYKKDCQRDTYPLTLITPKSISYSTADLFWLCPERSRRSELEKAEKGEGKEELKLETKDVYQREIGSAVHRGLGEIYKQVWRIS